MWESKQAYTTSAVFPTVCFCGCSFLPYGGFLHLMPRAAWRDRHRGDIPLLWGPRLSGAWRQVGSKLSSVLPLHGSQGLEQLLLDLHNLPKSDLRGLGGIGALQALQVALQLGLGFVHGERMQPSGLHLRCRCARFGKLVALVRDGSLGRGHRAVKAD